MKTNRQPMIVAILFAWMLLNAVPSRAEDWPRFRGVNGSGVSSESDAPPLKWSPTENIRWKVALPGPGVSSPIVVGDRIFVTCYSGYGVDRANPGDIKNLKRHLLCMDRTDGKELWRQTVDAKTPEDPYSGIGVTAHGYASHTPASDGERVFAFFGKSGVHAYDLDGKRLWKATVGKGSDPWAWGSSSSPIVHGNLVIVVAAAESEAIYALDTTTGKIAWSEEAGGLAGMWGTPILAKVGERTELIMSVPSEIWSLNASNGDFLWYCVASRAEQAHSSAVLGEGVVYTVSGRGGASTAVKVGGKEDVSKSHLVWTGRDTAQFGTPVLYKDTLYLVANGVVKAIDRETGKTRTQVRLGASSQRETPPRSSGRRRGGRFGSLNYASPVIAGEHLFYLEGKGAMHVFRLGDEPKLVSVNQTSSSGEQFGGTPAIADNQIYLRSNKHLYCIGK